MTEAEIIARLEAGTGATVTSLTPAQTEALIHPEMIGPGVSKPVPVDKFLEELDGEKSSVVGPDKDIFGPPEEDLPFPASASVGITIDDKKLTRVVKEISAGMTLDQAIKVVDALPPAEKYDPFADITDPDVLFLINEWGVTEGERIIVRAEVASVVLKSTVKRSEFSKDQFDIQEYIIPKNLTCNMIIDHVPAKIAETGSDLVIINEFLQRAARELDDVTVGIVRRRTDAQQLEARAEAAKKVGRGVQLGEPISDEVEL